MSATLRPATPDDLPGLEQTVQRRYASGGASPRSDTFQLPGYGVFLVDIHAWAGNPQIVAEATFLVRWHRYDVAGAGANTTARSDLLGAVAFSDNGSNTLNTLTLSNPSQTGVLTASLSWSDTATTRTPEITFTAVRLRNGLLLQ